MALNWAMLGLLALVCVGLAGLVVKLKGSIDAFRADVNASVAAFRDEIRDEPGGL